MNYEEIFTDDYVAKEVAFMGLPRKDTKIAGAALTWRNLGSGRIDDYLSVNYRVDPIDVPMLRLGSTLWMSLTPMEVQSAAVAIERGKQHKRVAVGGLGMGYVPLRLAEAGVEVDVYERDMNVIKLFRVIHRDRLSNINFIVGDVRETLQGQSYDYVFMDIYETLLPNEIRDDIELFMGGNDIKEYRYWGQELVFYVSSIYGEVADYVGVTSEEDRFFAAFEQTEGSSLRPPITDGVFCDAVLETHVEYGYENATNTAA